MNIIKSRMHLLVESTIDPSPSLPIIPIIGNDKFEGKTNLTLGW